MTAFNWELVRASPLKFGYVCIVFAFYALHLSISRLLTAFQEHPTNYVTALKSLLLKTVFRLHYLFVYSSPSTALQSSRRIDGQGWQAFEFDFNTNQRLKDYDAVILYFHGGGYAIGEPLQYAVTYKRWKVRAAQRGVHLAIVALKYPLTTEGFPFPAQRNAGLAAYEYLVQQEGVLPSQIVLAGDSAGGNLAASLLLNFRDHPEEALPAGTVLISPWLDPSLSKTAYSSFSKYDFVYGDDKPTGTREMAMLLAGGKRSPESPDISLALNNDLRGVPGHLCSYGSAEVYQEDSKMWIESCKADNVDVEEYCGKGGVHTFSLGGLTADLELQEESDDVLLTYIIKTVGIEKA